MNAIHRGLYAYTPQDAVEARAGPRRGRARRSARTARPSRSSSSTGVMFSKPVNREVEAKDVKYAHRARLHGQRRQRLRPRLPGRHQGRPEEAGRLSRRSPGIETPDKYTIVLHLTKGTGAAPRARSRCRSRSRSRRSSRRSTTQENPSTYGEEAAVYTGPYMVKSDADGKATGYVAGKTHRPGPQPGLRPGGRLPPRVPRRDRVPGRQRRHRGGDAPHPERREPRRRRHRAAGAAAQGAAGDQQAGALGGAGRWLAHDLDGQRAVRRSTTSTSARPTIAGFNRVAARQQRGGEALGPDRPGLHPAGHGRVRGVRRPRRLHRRPRTGWRSRRATATCRPSTSRRPAWPRASTRATRRS